MPNEGQQLILRLDARWHITLRFRFGLQSSSRNACDGCMKSIARRGLIPVPWNSGWTLGVTGFRGAPGFPSRLRRGARYLERSVEAERAADCQLVVYGLAGFGGSGRSSDAWLHWLHLEAEDCPEDSFSWTLTKSIASDLIRRGRLSKADLQGSCTPRAR